MPEPPSYDDLEAQWAAATDEIRDALADATVARTLVTYIFGGQPFEQLVGGVLCADTLIHTWDLAQASGQGDQLDQEAVTAALAFLTPIDGALRRPGGFGPKRETVADADAQTRLLAFVGRSP